MVAGNTAAGVYHEWPEAPVLISLRDVRELSRSVKSKVMICRADCKKHMASVTCSDDLI